MTQEITISFLKALSERNLKAITALFADKVDWYIPGNEILAPWLGKRETREEVKAFFELLWENTQPLAANIDNIFVEGNEAIIAGSFTSKMLKTDAVCESLFFIHLRIEHNLIVRYRLLEDTYEVVKALSR